MPQYELVTILSPQIGEDDVPAALERINTYIANRGGEVTNVDQWGRRRLAYPIKRFTEGTYIVTELTLPAPGVAELDANLRISEDVIRHLIVRKDEK